VPNASDAPADRLPAESLVPVPGGPRLRRAASRFPIFRIPIPHSQFPISDARYNACVRRRQ